MKKLAAAHHNFKNEVKSFFNPTLDVLEGFVFAEMLYVRLEEAFHFIFGIMCCCQILLWTIYWSVGKLDQAHQSMDNNLEYLTVLLQLELAWIPGDKVGVSKNVSSWFPKPLLWTIFLPFYKIMKLPSMPIGIKDHLNYVLRLTMEKKSWGLWRDFLK